MKNYKLLKEYLTLLLENESNLISSDEAGNLIDLKLEEVLRNISDVATIVSENDMSGLFEEEFLKELGVTDRFTIWILVGLDYNLSLDKIKEYLRRTIWNSSEKKEEEGGALLFNQSDLETNIQKVIDASTECKKVIDKILQKINDDSTSDFEEAPGNAPLGKVAFPALRSNVPLEKNTPIETALQKAILDHIIASDSIKKEDAKLIKSFISKNWYTSAFSEPDVQVVYRGMAVTESYIKEILNEESLEESGSKEINWDFSPRRESSSWTKSEKSAMYFAKQGRGPITLILTANISDNPDKFIDLKNIYSFKKFSNYKTEEEIIGIGNIKVSKIEWRSKKPFIPKNAVLF